MPTNEINAKDLRVFAEGSAANGYGKGNYQQIRDYIVTRESQNGASGNMLNHVYNDGYTLLQIASALGSTTEVKALICKENLRKGLKLNTQDNNGFTALHHVAFRGIILKTALETIILA